MNALKRTAIALLALLPLATGVAVADTEHGYSRIFVFGASLVDSGNHFAFTGETAHPPFEFLGPSYGVGGHHFSNGRTWVEVLAQDMKLTDWAKPAWRDPTFGNYAMGYGRAREFGWDPLPSLYDQVQAWDDNGYCTHVAMDDTLFIIDSAYFDLLDLVNGEDAFSVMNGMTTSIAENIKSLYDCGARNLLFAYIPPLDESPIVEPPDDPTAPSLAIIYNYMFLQPMLQFYAGEPYNMNVSAVDFYILGMAMITQPQAFGLTNVTDTCVTFGVTRDAFCKNRDEFFFWDPLHPTKHVHAMFAAEALAVLPTPD